HNWLRSPPRSSALTNIFFLLLLLLGTLGIVEDVARQRIALPSPAPRLHVRPRRRNRPLPHKLISGPVPLAPWTRPRPPRPPHGVLADVVYPRRAVPIAAPLAVRHNLPARVAALHAPPLAGVRIRVVVRVEEPGPELHEG